MTAPAPPLLAVNNLEVVYHHSVQVLKGLSLAVPEGRIVALLGSNGAGKTTALKAISGLLPLENGAIEAGAVTYRGQDLAGLLPHQIARRGIFQVREGRHVFEDLTVEENLLCATYARPSTPARWRRNAPGATGRGGKAVELDRVYDYFPRLRERRGGLGGYLSGGEQQMLAIGRALVAGPDLMLLDEPSLGLSPLLVEEIFAIVERINREQGTTILLVEQNAHMALQLASHGYIMENGKVVLDGPVERLRQDRDVQEFYLGRRGGQAKSYREVKHYKRRKRWLS
ncbi:MAG: ABC transporter ATP-binding protein [Deltaproteobacteria bacterium]|nr:ABC transporter ATP-binding protein [Deltaproteobacteria bacterium]